MNGSSPYRLVKFVANIVVSATLVCVCTSILFAQQIRIAHIQPDALAPGMTAAIEIMAPASDSGAFGTDGIYLPSERIAFINPSDSLRVVFGPLTVSWNGRVLQAPIMVVLGASSGDVFFSVLDGNRKSSAIRISIAALPLPSISLVGTGELGDGGQFGTLTSGNTLIVDQIDLTGTGPHLGPEFTFTTTDPNPASPGNPRYHPVMILALHGVVIQNAELSVSADGVNGGPGGGGGGAGFAGSGGAGYTGGGSDTLPSTVNVGSGKDPTETNGGASTTGVLGGSSSGFNSDNSNQGGGGGTGCPYGTSGTFSGGNDTSQAGGFGGASAGGETPGTVYGGGGGAFATDGSNGSGIGANGGHSCGGRFLIPMQGGSGGGAGNATLGSDSTTGSGGGGGGAITIVSFDKISFSQSTISARGAFGSSSADSIAEAGGGGGSGGAIHLASRHGISFDQSTLDASGGGGGLGAKNIDTTSKGGNGGFGIVRIDGSHNDTCQTCRTLGVRSAAPIVIPVDSQLHGPFGIINGISGSKDKNILLDTIRIYYRNHHSPWHFIDTVRDTIGITPRWHVQLPLGHDSLLFVSVFEKVVNPAALFANYEPEWLTGHLGSAVIRVVPTPNPVTITDTLDFGCIKVDSSADAPLLITNLGEKTLAIDSVRISDSVFTLTHDTNSIGGYILDSLVIRYSPHLAPRKDTAKLTIYWGDSTRIVVLVGCANDKNERLRLSASSLNFGRVHVDSCTTLSFVAKSIGKDTIVLHLANLSHPPFNIISPLRDTALAPKDSVRIIMQFCPTDSGTAHTSFILSDNRDSIVASGIGIIRVLRTAKNISGKTLCANECDSTRIVLSSLGNDAVIVTGISGAQILSPPLPFIMAPHIDTEVVVRYCNNAVATDTVQFITTSDTAVETAIHLTPVQIAFSLNGKTAFGPLCISSQDSGTISLARNGTDTIVFDSILFRGGAPFTMRSQIPSRDSLRINVRYSPTVSGLVTDTIFIFARSGPCDSVIIIPLHGEATSSGAVFSLSTIRFGVIDTGQCTFDSTIVSLPCGSNEQIQLATQKPFTIVLPANGIVTLTNGSQTTVMFRYCPITIGVDSQVITIKNPNGDSLITLIGTGSAPPLSPYIRFSLPSVLEGAGTTFKYVISIDSVRDIDSVKQIDGTLSYDPQVVMPTGLPSGANWNVVGAEATPGNFNFTANGSSLLSKGKFATITMQPLYSQANSTIVSLSNISTVIAAATASDTGKITLTDCSNLPGNIIVAGPYGIDKVYANPVSSSYDIDVSLGAEGSLNVKVFDVTGALVRSEMIPGLTRGKHRFEIDVSSLPSGVYRTELESLGWRGGNSFIIQH